MLLENGTLKQQSIKKHQCCFVYIFVVNLKTSSFHPLDFGFCQNIISNACCVVHHSLGHLLCLHISVGV